MIPDILKKGRVALKAGMSELELRQRLKNGFSARDKRKIAEVYETIIEDLTRRIKEIREG